MKTIIFLDWHPDSDNEVSVLVEELEQLACDTAARQDDDTYHLHVVHGDVEQESRDQLDEPVTDDLDKLIHEQLANPQFARAYVKNLQAQLDQGRASDGGGESEAIRSILSDVANRLEALDHPAYETVCTALGQMGADDGAK